MLGGRRRVFGWGCVAGSVLVAGVAIVAPALPSGAEGGAEAGRPPVWAGDAAAAAVEVYGNTKPEQIIPEILKGDLPDGVSSWSSTGAATGRASTFYPGLLVAQGPTLLCTAGFPCQSGFPPPYPLSAVADYPNTPDAAVDTGQNLGGKGAPLAVTANSAVAHAARDNVVTTAVDHGIEIAGSAGSSAASVDFRRRATLLLKGALAASFVSPTAADASAFHADSATATTRHSFDKDGVLIVHAEAQLHGVRMAGDTVHADSILSVSEARVDGDKITKNTSTLTMSGVTVAGQPAQITDKGIVISPGPAQGKDIVDQLNNSLNDNLKANNTQIMLLGTSQDTKNPGVSKGTVQGVLFSTQIDASAVPSGGTVINSILLGKVGTAASASKDAPPDATAAASDTPTGAVAGAGAAALPASSGSDSSSASPLPANDATPAQASSTAAPAAAPAAGGKTETALGLKKAKPIGANIAAKRMKLLYLSFMLACFGVAALRKFLPARWPALRK